MKTTGWMILIYALIVFLGGIFGYMKAGSAASLVSGVTFSAILGISAFVLFNGKLYGFYVATATAALLAAFFLYRFLLTYKFMPSGLMCIISLAMLAILLIKRTDWKTKEIR